MRNLRRQLTFICLLFCYHVHNYSPPLPFSASQFRVWIPRPRPEITFSPRVNSADSRCGGVGGGLGSPLAGFSRNTEISFLMISPYLLDFCPVFLLIFSPLEIADFFMLFKPSGDGYSLLCSKKQLLQHNQCIRTNPTLIWNRSKANPAYSTP